MKLKPINLFTALIFAAMLSITAEAAPAKKGRLILSQPDGSTFAAYIKGDEFMKIKMTAEGNAIIQEADGWWYYAEYDWNGNRSSTGYKVGRQVPSDILLRSTCIPSAALQEKAAQKRRTHAIHGNDIPITRRLLTRAGVMTRSEESDGIPTKHGLIILAQFKDKSFRHTREDFVRLLDEEGYSLNGATGCIKEYFNDQFKDMMDFEFQVSDIVTVSKNMAYYGGNDADGSDKNPAMLIKEACELADSQIDFSMYDDDDDGVVDNVFVFFAGEDEAEGGSENCIWSHAWYVYSGAGITLMLDGKYIDNYACTSELTKINDTSSQLTGIGTFCHEYSHTLGLPDLYDTDYEENGGYSASLWSCTSIMDGGNYNNIGNTPPNYNAIEREILGISTPEYLQKGETYTLSPIHKDNRYFRMDGQTEREYYLIECRSNEGWDAYIGGNGLLIYHIDKSGEASKIWDFYNTVNANPRHQHADLVEADSRNDRFADIHDYGSNLININGIFFPQTDVTSFTNESTPAFKFWDGSASDLSIIAIRRDEENIIFSVIGANEEIIIPDIVNVSTYACMDAAIINFESSLPYAEAATISWGRSGQDEQTLSVEPYENGKYSLTIEGLDPGGKAYTVTMHFENEMGIGTSKKVSFMTKKRPPVDWVYIYMGGIERNDDGTFPIGTGFPLRLHNASDAETINWQYNGQEIMPAGDGFFRPAESGTLEAKVVWPDGSEDIIIKEITITN